MKRRGFLKGLLALAGGLSVCLEPEPDKLTAREYDEFLEMAMRYGSRTKYPYLHGEPPFVAMGGINQYIQTNL